MAAVTSLQGGMVVSGSLPLFSDINVSTHARVVPFPGWVVPFPGLDGPIPSLDGPIPSLDGPIPRSSHSIS